MILHDIGNEQEENWGIDPRSRTLEMKMTLDLDIDNNGTSCECDILPLVCTSLYPPVSTPSVSWNEFVVVVYYCII